MKKQMKKTIAVLLSVLLCCSALTAMPVSAFAATTAEQTVGATSGTTGDCTWTLDKATGTLTISGNGAMGKYNKQYQYGSDSYVTTASWGYSMTSVIIEDGVTSIGDYAFFGCTGLTSVTIPDSVTSIGRYAFYCCEGLTSVTIPDSVTFIDSGAFYGCKGLTSVTIPDSVTNIGYDAFSDTAWFDNQPDGLVYAGKVAYKYKGSCPANVEIKAGTLGIAGSAFAYCRGLKSITIPDSVTSIGEDAFYNCTGLTSVRLPDSVTSIGESAFYGCTGLTSVTIPDSVTSIGNYAFGYYYNSWGDRKEVKGFTIYGRKDSAAETYAKKNGFTFIELYVY